MTKSRTPPIPKRSWIYLIRRHTVCRKSAISLNCWMGSAKISKANSRKTGMTSSERISVYNWILSGECFHGDICWEAGNRLKELRKSDHPFDEEIPFEKIYNELAANLL